MGYEARLELADQRGRRWVGVHTPACADLRDLFTPLLAEEGLSEGSQALIDRLPDDVGVQAQLGPNALGLHAPGLGDNCELVLKWVPPSQRGPLDALVHATEGSRAQRAHLMAHRLRAFGLSVPRPLGYLERAHAPRRHPSLHVSAYVRSPDLRAWWAASLAEGSQAAQEAALRRQCLMQLAQALRMLRSQGLFHGDLHAENILVTPTGVVLLDLESVRSTGRGDRLVKKGLLRLDRDARELGGLRSVDRLRFLQEFFRHSANAGALRRHWWRVLEAGAASPRVVAALEPDVPSEDVSPPL